MYKIEYALPCYTAQQRSNFGCDKMRPMFITSKTVLHLVPPSVRIKTGQKMPHPNDIFPVDQSRFKEGLCTLNRFATLLQSFG